VEPQRGQTPALTLVLAEVEVMGSGSIMAGMGFSFEGNLMTKMLK
jgi:hypothetical protein